MARDIHADTLTALSGEILAPIGMVALEFGSGTLRLWSGIGELSWGGFTWTGAGDLGTIGAIEETTEIRAVSVPLMLSGIPAELLEIAVDESWQGRPASIYYAVLKTTGNNLEFVGEPLLLFRGFMDQMNLTEGEENRIQLTLESRQIDLERTKARRQTAEDQRAEYPGDRGYDQVAALQEKVIRLPS